MPVNFVWEDEEKTILHHIYEGMVSSEEYFKAVIQNYEMQQTVTHPVYVISDLVNAKSAGKLLFSVAGKETEKYLPPNQTLVVVVSTDLFTKVILQIAKTVAPKTSANVVRVSTLEEAYQIIEKTKLAKGSVG
jgi:hypothetical protein